MAGSNPSPLANLAGGVGSLLEVLREVDVRPIRAASEKAFTLAMVSRDEPLAQHLSALMYRGDRAHDLPRIGTCIALPFAERDAARHVEIVVVVTRDDHHNTEEIALVQQLLRAKVPVIVCLLGPAAQTGGFRSPWLPAPTLTLPLDGENVLDEAASIKALVRAVRRLKAVDELALARQLPAFREPVVRSLIDDVALANATYAVGTGVLEIVPVVNVPLNMADMLVLTKNQSIMAYKIALAMGMNSEFKEVMPQLAAVVGSGFLWRQAARSLIGLVPGLGIVPKVAVAYAGTRAMGEVVYRWCITGERIRDGALKPIYNNALLRGKELGARLFKRRRSGASPSEPEAGPGDDADDPSRAGQQKQFPR